MTIGYGTQDTFFNECGIAAFLITVQSLLAIFLDSVFIGLVFSRLGRAQQRAASVVFSDKAVIQQIDGQLHFMFQVRGVAFIFVMRVPLATYVTFNDFSQYMLWLGNCKGRRNSRSSFCRSQCAMHCSSPHSRPNKTAHHLVSALANAPPAA